MTLNKIKPGQEQISRGDYNTMVDALRRQTSLCGMGMSIEQSMGSPVFKVETQREPWVYARVQQSLPVSITSPAITPGVDVSVMDLVQYQWTEEERYMDSAGNQAWRDRSQVDGQSFQCSQVKSSAPGGYIHRLVEANGYPLAVNQVVIAYPGVLTFLSDGTPDQEWICVWIPVDEDSGSSGDRICGIPCPDDHINRSAPVCPSECYALTVCYGSGATGEMAWACIDTSCCDIFDTLTAGDDAKGLSIKKLKTIEDATVLAIDIYKKRLWNGNYCIIDWSGTNTASMGGAYVWVNNTTHGIGLRGPIEDSANKYLSVDTNSRLLVDETVGHKTALDWSLRRAYDSSGTELAIDWNVRWLVNYNDSVIVVDWMGDAVNGNAYMSFGPGGKLQLANGCTIYSTDTHESIKTNTRELVAANGTTIALDWSSGLKTAGQTGLSTTITYQKSLVATGTLTFTNGLLTGST